MKNDSHARSSTTCRAGANRARYDAAYLQELVQALRQRQRQRKKEEDSGLFFSILGVGQDGETAYECF